MKKLRVLSGMRPTGSLHLGHLEGALKNWVAMQDTHQCFYFSADYHALTTHYDASETIAQATHEMVIDWLAAGIDPAKSVIFEQSKVLQHAELTLLLGMVTPLSWLERVPTYKDQIEKLKHKDLGTYGFLGYPLMQAADILIYGTHQVPVGQDQVPHIEMTREIARRFNSFFGKEKDFEALLQAAQAKLGANASVYVDLRKRYNENGDATAREQAQALIESAALDQADTERLLGHLDGTGRAILTLPQAALTEVPVLPGLDGDKMSKSYGNTIALREDPDSILTRVKRMKTDPARVRKTDPGNPDNCPVWKMHKIYSDSERQAWVQDGCRNAKIGCIECKTPVAEKVVHVLEPIRRRGVEYAARPDTVRDILSQGAIKAREQTEQTMSNVRKAMGF